MKIQNYTALVAQWIERLFPKQKVVGSTPTWRVYNFYFFFVIFNPLSNFIKKISNF